MTLFNRFFLKCQLCSISLSFLVRAVNPLLWYSGLSFSSLLFEYFVYKKGYFNNPNKFWPHEKEKKRIIRKRENATGLICEKNDWEGHLTFKEDKKDERFSRHIESRQVYCKTRHRNPPMFAVNMSLRIKNYRYCNIFA